MSYRTNRKTRDTYPINVFPKQKLKLYYQVYVVHNPGGPDEWEQEYGHAVRTLDETKMIAGMIANEYPMSGMRVRHLYLETEY